MKFQSTMGLAFFTDDICLTFSKVQHQSITIHRKKKEKEKYFKAEIKEMPILLILFLGALSFAYYSEKLCTF